MFNRLTGLHAKTGNYPGVTVSRTRGVMKVHDHTYNIEDLPGSYSLTPISPDEQVVSDMLNGKLEGVGEPDALLVVADSTALRRSLLLLSEVLPRHKPTALAVTMTDELRRRGGVLDIEGLSKALGIPVVAVVANRGIGIPELRKTLTEWQDWSRPPIDPPADPAELAGWVDSILASAGYEGPNPDSRTEKIDKVLLHPVWGTIIFFAVMFLFFQALFTWAAPLQDAIDTFFGYLAGWSTSTSPIRCSAACSVTASWAASARCSPSCPDPADVPDPRVARRGGLYVPRRLPDGQGDEQGRP